MSNLLTYSGFICLFIFFASSIADRNVTHTVNPGCTNCTDEVRLLMVESVSKADRSIYLLSSIGAPTVLTMYFNSSKDVEVTFDWNCLAKQNPNCITSSPHPQYVSSYVVYKLIEYDDTKGIDVTQYAADFSQVRSIPFSEMSWFPMSAGDIEDSNPTWRFLLNSTSDKHDIVNANSSDAYLTLDFIFYSGKGRMEEKPSILHSDMAGSFEIGMSNMSLHFAHSRFAVEVMTVAQSLPDTSSVASKISVDDEYSPGVFEVVTWKLSGDSLEPTPTTYLHWKPVTYTKRERNFESIKPVKYSKPRYFNYDDLQLTKSGGLTVGYFGNDVTFLNIQSTNFSTGATGDKFYAGYNYTTFVVLHGFGEPLYDSMSAGVIVAIGFGVGVPTLLIITGAIVIISRKIRALRSGQKPELLINAE